MQAIIDGWWKVLALLAGAVVAIWGLVFALVHFLRKAKDSGIDEIQAGMVKIDFDEKPEPDVQE